MSIILGFSAGLGIFLYGTHLLSNALQKIGASKMRSYLGTITKTRIKAMLSGIVVTFFLQSSTVTNILVVGLVGGSIITSSQALGVVLGSAIGTTLTVQILTFDISQYSSIFIFFGTMLIIFTKKSNLKSIGQIMLSIGFIFYGIGLITSSLDPLSENSQVLEFLINVSDQPILFALIAMILAALMHSSAAVIIIGIAFITSNVLPLPAVIPLVLGANVGSTIPVVLSSLASQPEGKKLGLFYFFFKTTGVIIAMIFLSLIMDVVPHLPGNPGRQIAHFHTLFNIGIALIFLPILPLIAKMFRLIFPTKKDELTFYIKLNDNLLDVPEEALISSRREVVKLADMVGKNMINQLKRYIQGKKSATEIYEVEQIINHSYVKIQQYLLQIGQRDLTRSQSNEEVNLLNLLNDIEHIGDMVVRFLDKSEQTNEKSITLSERDEENLLELLTHIENAYDHSLIAFKDDDKKIARKNIQHQSYINQFEKDTKLEHFNSLINQQEYNPEISAIYLDIVNQLLQVYHHSMNISRTVIGLI